MQEKARQRTDQHGGRVCCLVQQDAAELESAGKHYGSG